MVKIKIHRGTDQIGGAITEIYTETTHIFLDFGSELPGSTGSVTDCEMIETIKAAECDAVLFSHYHGDHVGMFGKIPQTDSRGKQIQLGIGKTARKMLLNIYHTLATNVKDTAENRAKNKKLEELLRREDKWIDFHDKQPFWIGDIQITPVRVDHSAFDAYLFLLETQGKTIVYTGDFRTHGRLGKGMFAELETFFGGKNVDVLLTEGTMLARSDEEVLTEEMLEEEAYQLLKKPENKYAFLVCSSTNFESLASFSHAAHRLKRAFFVNHYVDAQIEEFKKAAPKDREEFQFYRKYKFENMERINPCMGCTQPEYMRKNGFLMLVGPSAAYQKRMDYFKDLNPILIYSMWEGYIEKEKYPDTYRPDYGALYDRFSDDRHTVLHSGGHATAADIEKMVHIIKPQKAIIPIHTTKKEQFKELEIGAYRAKVHTMQDGDELEL
ncbi:MAG: MBL fold metallo-hydrolase [Lachnospiraceae bacterium]